MQPAEYAAAAQPAKADVRAGFVKKLVEPQSIFAAAISILFSLPLILILVTRAEYLVFGTESLAYRYFACARIWEGDRRTVWLPQGQLFTVLQHGIWWLLNLLGIHDLRMRLQSFGLATTVLTTLLGIALIVWVARNHLLQWTDKALIAFATLGPIYLLRYGLFYSSSADYYSLDIVLGGAALAMFIWQLRGAQPTPGRVGLFCGLLVANKVTLLALALMCTTPVLLRSTSWRGWLRNAWRLARGALVGLTAIFFIFHGFDGFTMVELIARWFHIMSSLGPEPNFWSNLPSMLRHGGYGLAGAWWILTLIGLSCVAWFQRDAIQPRARVLFSLVAATPLLLIVGLIKRPAYSTVFEIAIILLVSAAAMLAVAPRLPRRVFPTIIGVWMIWGITQASSSLPEHYRSLRASPETGEQSWAMYRDEYSRGKHVTFIIKDNYYIWPGIEIAALKGLSECPTWNIESAKPMFERILPNSTILTGTQIASSRIQSGLVIWKDSADGKPLLVSQEYESLRSIIRRSACRPYYLGLTICEVSEVSQAAPRQAYLESLPASKILPATRELTAFIASIHEPGMRLSQWHRQNLYHGDAYVVIEGKNVVLHYPNVPKADCSEIMRQIDGAVNAIGVEGHSPGWRYTVTPDVAAVDCAGPVNQLNFWVR